MTIKINGTNTTAQPSITGADTDTGLVYGTDQVQVVTGGTTRITVDGSGNTTATGTAEFGGVLSVNRTNSGDGCFHAKLNGTTKASIASDGSATFGGNISITTSDITNNATRAQGNNGYHLGNNSVHVLSKNVGNNSVVLDVYGSNGQFKIMGDGDAQNTNNNYSGVSDLKLKENIVDANSQWDDIKAIQVRNYNFKADTGYETHTQIGVVAQELEAVCPGLIKDCIDEDADSSDLGTTTKTVTYSVLYMKGIKALQEAQTRIETLETQNASQAATIAAIEARFTALEGGAE